MSIKKHRIISLAASAVVLIVDQLVKYLVAANFELFYTTPIIKGLLEFCYLHNDGAAMGMLSGNRIFLIAIPVLMIAAILFFEFSGRINSPFLMWALNLVVGGGIGNLIDRIRFGYVVDFIRFPVSFFNYSFNIADCAVTVGAAMMIIYLIIDIFRSGKKDGKENLSNSNRN